MIASGTEGTCQWTIDDNGNLRLEAGVIPNRSNVSEWGWYPYRSQIKTVTVSSIGQPLMWEAGAGAAGMFANCTNLVSIDTSRFNTSNVTNMEDMFYNCSGLTSLDVSGFDTSNVTNMGYMFRYCSSVTSLDVSRFNTSNVTNMGSMFSSCSSLTSLDVSGFNTSNVTNMEDMFYNCSGLTSLDVSGFNTSNVTTMNSMFDRCLKLTSLDVSGFNTSNVTNMGYMFRYCSSVTSLNVSGFDTSKVTNMYSMFAYCSSLLYLELRVSNVLSGLSYQNIFTGTNCPTYIINSANTQEVANSWRTVAAGYSNVHFEVDDCEITCISNQIYRSLLPFELLENGIYLNSNLLFESNSLLPRAWTIDRIIDESILTIKNLKDGSEYQTSGTWEENTPNQWRCYNSKIEKKNDNYQQITNVEFACKDNTGEIKGEVKTVTNSINYIHPESLIYASFQEGDYLYYITDDINQKVTAFVYDKTKTSYSNLTDEIIYDNQTYILTELREYIDGEPSKGCYEDCINLINSPSIANLTDVTSLERCFQNCSSLQNFGIAPDFDTIPSQVTNVANCFYGCSSLTGNINVLPVNIDNSNNIFTGTALPIYIVRGRKTIQLEDVWKPIARNFDNVYFEADDNSPPALSILELTRGKYKDGKWISSDEATHIKGVISYSAFSDHLPMGWNAVITKNHIDIFIDEVFTEVIWEPESSTIFYIPLTTNPELTHDITIRISDTYHTTYADRVVIGLFAMMDFVPGGKGMAIGSVASRNGLDISIPTTIGFKLEPPTTYDRTNDTEFHSTATYYKLVDNQYREISKSDKYVLTEDESVQSATTYYELIDSQYEEITPLETDNPKQNGWYVHPRPIDMGWFKNKIDLTNPQLIVGQYNEKNNNATLIIGDGTQDARSNALEVCYGTVNGSFGETTGSYFNFGVRKNTEDKNSGYLSFIQGMLNEAEGAYSHAEGWGTAANGDVAHAEGVGTVASGGYTHAEGANTVASGDYAHVEGAGAVASGDGSHAEGMMAVASGYISHAGGYGTIAASDMQTALGNANIEDNLNKYSFIIGNGDFDDDKRSNALAVTWDGDIHTYLDLSDSNSIDYKIYQIAQTYPEAIISEDTELSNATVSLKSLLYHALTWD